MTVFVRANGSPGMKVTSRVEEGGRRAGCPQFRGRATAPNTLPKASGRVAWFRQDCLTCQDAARPWKSIRRK